MTTTEPNKRQSIGRENAIKLHDSSWWTGLEPRVIAEFQFFTEELCVPFGVFHEAIEKTLGRPVWTHEFVLNWDGIAAELRGEKSAPTMDEIMSLIPAEKRIIIALQQPPAEGNE